MKLRCTHNSIRLRVRKSDLERLTERTLVRECISLGNHCIFCFELKLADKIQQIEAQFEHETLRVLLPITLAYPWINSQEVGLEIYHALPAGEQLHLLIEKDFPCTDRLDEDKDDTFWELSEEKPETC